MTGKDYSIGKGIVGELLFGASEFACGFSDSRNTEVSVYWICTKCGFKFKAKINLSKINLKFLKRGMGVYKYSFYISFL